MENRQDAWALDFQFRCYPTTTVLLTFPLFLYSSLSLFYGVDDDVKEGCCVLLSYIVLF